jgi:hypothetical protein
MKLMFTGLLAVVVLSGCTPEAQRASYNMSIASKNFEVNRRCVFYNGITGEYILTIEGMLSVVDDNSRLEVMVKTGPSTYKKHYLGLSDNVTYFVEQVEPAQADPYRYRVIFRPQTILPNVEVR